MGVDKKMQNQDLTAHVVGQGSVPTSRSWLDSAVGRLFRWLLTYGLPMYLIVGALIYIGIHGLFGGTERKDVLGESIADSALIAEGAGAAAEKNDDASVAGGHVPVTALQSDGGVITGGAVSATPAAIAIAKFAVESTKDRIDSLRDSYEKLFGVIATLGALLAFLGFKGVESFMVARTKAQETVEKASAAVLSANAAKEQAEKAIEKLRKFLEEDYPRDSRSEVNVVHGIVMREIADVYGAIAESQGKKKECEAYFEALEQSLYYLKMVPCHSMNIDAKIACRALVSIGNVKRRLGDVRGALDACKLVLEKFDSNDDSAHYNFACYSCLLAKEASDNGRHDRAVAYGADAIGALVKAIEIDPRRKEPAARDPDFEWFQLRKDPAFLQAISPLAQEP